VDEDLSGRIKGLLVNRVDKPENQAGISHLSGAQQLCSSFCRPKGDATSRYLLVRFVGSTEQFDVGAPSLLDHLLDYPLIAQCEPAQDESESTNHKCHGLLRHASSAR
jgi:hypothetical protein